MLERLKRVTWSNKLYINVEWMTQLSKLGLKEAMLTLTRREGRMDTILAGCDRRAGLKAELGKI